MASASSISSSVTSSDGASRMAVGVTALTTRPRVEGGGGHVRGRPRRASSAARSSPRPRTDATPGRAASPSARRAPARVARAGTSSASITASAARAAAAARGWPPKVVPWSPGTKATATSARAQQAPMGMPLPEGLGHGDDVGPDALVLEPEPLAGAAQAGLDLVEHEQHVALVAQPADVGQPALGRHVDPALALDGLDQHRAPPSGSTAASMASMSPRATWRKPSGRGWKGSCLAGWPVAARVASVRPWNEP